MSRGKKLMGLLLVLVVLAGAAFAAKRLNPENQETEEETETGVSVFTLDADSVTALSWTYGEESLTFEQSDGGWVYGEDSGFPLDSTYIETMLAALSDVTASKTIEDPEDLAQYGLEEPACTVSVTAGETTQLVIGDETELGGSRYLSLGDGNVYLVDTALLDSFSYGLYDLLEQEDIPSMTEVRSLSVDTGSQALEIQYLEDSGLAYSDEYVWFLEQEEGYLTLDTELTEALIANVTGLTWDECVNYQADEDDLAAYGLGGDGTTVTVGYMEQTQVETGETDEDDSPVYETVESEESFVLELGSLDSEGCYARMGGSGMVYRIDASVAESLLYTTYIDLLPDEVLLMDWDTVTGMNITLDGETYSVTKEEQEVTDEEGDTSITSVYLLDGAEIELSGVLDSLTALASTGTAYAAAPEDEAELRLVFYRNTETFSQVELAFYPYNSSSYLVTLDGASTVFTAREDVLSIVEALRELQ